MSTYIYSKSTETCMRMIDTKFSRGVTTSGQSGRGGIQRVLIVLLMFYLEGNLVDM